MVYCGKPSTGCRNCKNRRIKCDETPPFCNNCTRTNRDCPGFPQQVDLIFRNHNATRQRRRAKNRTTADANGRTTPVSTQDGESTEQLENIVNTPARRARPKRRHRRSTDGPDHDASIVVRYKPKAMVSPTFGTQVVLALSIEQQATAFLFETFMSAQEGEEATRGLLEVLKPMFNRAKEDGPLHLATEAVAVSVAASWPNQSELMHLAARLYGRALLATQKAIQDPKHATSDETLLTILLFSFYETVTSSPHSSPAWAKHIDGAVAIVKARGVKQFDNPQSLLLFRIVRTQMLTNSVQQQKKFEAFPHPGGWLSDMRSDSIEAFRLIDFSMALPKLLDTARTLLTAERSPPKVLKVQTLLSRAEGAQDAFWKWEQHMPLEWASSVVDHLSDAVHPENVEDLDFWPGPVHTYKDVHVSSIRNNVRVTQMLYSSVAVDALRWLDSDGYCFEERYYKARDTIQSLVDQICYSVPFHLRGPELDVAFNSAGREGSPTQAKGEHSLVWPLHVASTMQTIADDQRRWLRSRLGAIVRRLGLEQAAFQESSKSMNQGKVSANGNIDLLRGFQGVQTTHPTTTVSPSSGGSVCSD